MRFFRAQTPFQGFFLLVCTLAISSCIALPTRGQEIQFSPPNSPSAAPVALSGVPFGVLKAEFPLPPGLGDREPRILVSDAADRVFYPVVTIRTVEVVEQPPAPAARPNNGRRGGLLGGGRLGGGLVDRVRSAIRGAPEKKQVPVAVTVAALYVGDAPIDLSIQGDISQALRITPSVEAAGRHTELLSQWWESYTQSAIKRISTEDSPTLIDKYLVSMLSDRLGLPKVDLDPPDPEKEELGQPLETLALLAAIEPLREEILDDVLNYAGDSQATLPIPSEPNWLQTIQPPADPNVVIEELATRVPPECFYLRFGSFSNYVWFQDIAERYGGDIAQTVLLRGFNYDASARMERMLASKMTQIAKMFGDQLIGDMAVIGSDLYMKEGASLGVLFFAKNQRLLLAAIESDRNAVAGRNEDAQVQTLTIAGREVSLLSTPDNRIRSFLVSDGPYVFVTSSVTLARRFLEVAAGDASLAASPHFRLARSWMPDANDYAVFGYFSPEFFHRLVSPQYQIELRRRLEAIAHLEIAEVASQIAIAEGRVPNNIVELQANQLLPQWFDQRPDGAQTLRTEGRWVDSLRGARGSFLPIADVPIADVTQKEVDSYTQIANFYLDEWESMDPLIMGLRRFKADDGTLKEKVAFEGYIAPFKPEKYGWFARQLGEPTPVEIQLPADDAATLQVHVRGNSGIGPKSGDYHLFGGIKDMVPPTPEETEGLIKTLQALKQTPAYIGAWPKPGIIEQLPLGIGRQLAQPDFAGFSRMLGGLWRWQDGQFSLLSFDRSILDNAVTQLAAVEANDLAQARLKVANLSGSQLASWINSTWYGRGWKSSHVNTLLLDSVHQQLKVPSEECMDVTQRLLDVRLQCPLGGQYQFAQIPATTGTNGSTGWWESSAWSLATTDPSGRRIPPPDYAAPWIEWFRGGRVHLTQGDASLAVVGEIELEMQPLSVNLNPDEPTMLPKLDFDLFSLPMKLFGSSEQEETTQRRSF